MDLYIEFINNGIYKFCTLSCDYYLALIRGSYANMCIDALDEQFDDDVIKSRVNGIDFYVNIKLLRKLFDLQNQGKKCIGAKFKRNAEGKMCEINHDYLV